MEKEEPKYKIIGYFKICDWQNSKYNWYSFRTKFCKSQAKHLETKLGKRKSEEMKEKWTRNMGQKIQNSS